MKVIYDLQAYSFSPYGGVVRMFNETIARFNHKDDFSALLYKPSRILAEAPTGKNINMSLWTGLPGALRKHALPRKIYHGLSDLFWRSHSADIFHPSFYPLDAELFRFKTIVNIYDLIHEKIPHADDMPNHEQFLNLKKRAIEKADRLICISNATRDDLLEHYNVDVDKICVVYLGSNTNFRIMPEEESNRLAGDCADLQKPYILYIGSRQRYKNFHRLLTAYQSWPANKDVDLVVVGAPQKSADAAAHDLASGTGTVRYLNFSGDDVLCALYNKARFFVYPSLAEGFGIPLLESMASGCPVCVSDIPPFREVAGDAAVYFDPLSVEDMRVSFDRALNAREDNSIDERNKKCVSRFSWDKCAEEMWKVYSELLT